VLPKWLSPEIDRNRAWIHDGKLLIIPNNKEHPESSSSRNLSLADAVQLLKSKPDTLVHSAFVEAEAFYRLDKYPAHVDESMHHSLVTIPRNLAYILHALPKSVAPAVEAFYLRDAISLKPILSPSANLVFPPDDLVTVSVRFSKVLFAQLRSQRFEAPPRWKNAIQKAQTAGSGQVSKEFARLETGMKLTCGFEMLASTAGKNKSRVVREVAIMLEDMREDGDETLPTDEEIQSWPGHDRDDSEAWMDINYQDFERELEGRRAGSQDNKSGFGDVRTQADLQKIVSRFEAFLNDETAGLEGAELDDMDVDDDDNDDDEDDDSEDGDYEDVEVSFDEEEFSRMMREMMGLPAIEPTQSTDKGKVVATSAKDKPTTADEDAEIQELAAQMESELKQQGALALDPPADKSRRLKGKSPEAGPSQETGRSITGQDDSEDEEVDIDYNLAKNLLESFKSQAGMAGPTGNLLGLMGFQLPRDEDDGAKDDDDGSSGPSVKPSRSK
jgi:hypothetical protein